MSSCYSKRIGGALDNRPSQNMVGDGDNGGYAIMAGGGEDRRGQGAGEAQLLDDDPSAGGRGQATELGRLNVFREVACTSWPMRSPRYWEAPRGVFPPDVGPFLAGGLYMSIQRARYKLLPHYLPAYVVVFLFMLALFMALSWGTSRLYEESGESTEFNYVAFSAWVIVLCLFSRVPSWIITRPAVARFHEDVEAEVQALLPVFRQFGFDLEYRRTMPATRATSEAPYSSPSSWSRVASCLSCCDRESFVRITHFPRELTAEESALATAAWDPRNGAPAMNDPLDGRIKVTAYHEDSILQSCCRAELSFDLTPSYNCVKHQIDPFTWGAVAIESKAFNDATPRARLCIAAVAIVLHLVRTSVSSWYVSVPLHMSVLALVVALYYPCGLVTWCLMHVFGRATMFDEMRAAIQRLSPLVEERSGYRLRFETEADGCMGGTAAFVYFEPRVGGWDGVSADSTPALSAQFS